MPTFQQLLNKAWLAKWKRKIDRILWGCPQKRASVLKLRTMSPWKPNSATWKVAKVWILSTKISIIAYIPGQNHGTPTLSLQEHSHILLRGGWVPDLPGVHYKAIKGKLDFSCDENFDRMQWWSKFGISWPKEEY